MANAVGGVVTWNLNVDSSRLTAGFNKGRSEAKKLGSDLEKGLGDASKSAATTIRDNFIQAAAAIAGLAVGVQKLTSFMRDSVQAANRQQAAFIGLNSVATAFGQNADEATEAARRLSKDGLMPVGDAARGLKNLLAAGFSLPQAVKLMERFKDSAAFGRQSALSFGEAVASATEGIKNGNSILVDNAGVTKNLSIILEEAGFSAQDLMKATTDANVRLALFNGIIKETNPQLGDAAKFAETAAGKQAMFAQKTELLKAKIGESLQPALLRLLEALTPMIESFSRFVQEHPNVVSAVLIIGAVLGTLLVTLSSIGLAVIGLGPIFKIFSATAVAETGKVALAHKALAGAIASPIIMPAIAVAAALLAIAKVASAYQDLKREIAHADSAVDSLNRSMEQSLKKGKLTQDQIHRIQSSPGYTGDKTVFKQGAIYTPGYASGTNFAPGGMAIVGERGPELVNLPRGSEVIPNGEWQAGSKSEIHIGTINISKEVDGEKWLKKLTRNQEIFDNGLTPARNAW